MDISGKKIKELDQSSCNCWTLRFTDGTAVEIEVVAIHANIGLYGLQIREIMVPPPRDRTRTNRVQDGRSAS